ncbi:MAG: mandelate racemase/muconate lactonizing enzyme family protein [Streptosporangiales bacterium]|nr:mandelate racemase/muconate lactonizing enzyme family protein [Streptosporangiales bacterium]
MSLPTVKSIESVPLVYQLPDGAAYGSARGRLPARQSTLVRLTTSDGVIGWGEAFGSVDVVGACVRELAPTVIDRQLDSASGWFTHHLQRSYHSTYGGPHVAAASALDVAMWDALGRTLGVSVGRLLGGRVRDRVTAYASTGYVTATRDLAAFVDEITAAVEQGFDAVKIKLGLGPAEDRRRVEATREVIGADRALMVDFNGNYSADVALRVLRGLDDLDLAWAEEPVPPEDVGGMRLVRAAGVPTASGEALYTRFGFRDLIAERLVDVVQPDVCKCGGLSEARVIAHLAQTWNVRFSPHVWCGVVGQAASLQLLAAVPDYPAPEHVSEPLRFEFDRGPNALRDELALQPLQVSAGVVTIPDAPGLGVELDEQAIERLRSDR